MPVNVVILAAGMGTRLGRPHPKPLTPLSDGRSILRRQIDLLRMAYGTDGPIQVVVGFKMSQVMEACCGEVSFIYNELYDQTNTAYSLRRALHVAPPGGVLWLNADVVFVPELLGRLRPHLLADTTFVAVNTAPVGDEEVKYRVGPDGFIEALSKQVAGGRGEAVGINHISAADRDLLRRHLEGCGDQDYFERGLELAICRSGLRVRPVDIGKLGCVEVDTPADLELANLLTAARGRTNRDPAAVRPAIPARRNLA